MAENPDEGFDHMKEDVSDLHLGRRAAKRAKNNNGLRNLNQWIGDDCNQPSTSGTSSREHRKRDSNSLPVTKNVKKIRLDLPVVNGQGLRVDTPVHQLLNSAVNLDPGPYQLKNWPIDDDVEDDIQYLNRLSSNRRILDSWRDIDHTDSEAEDADASGQSAADGVRTLSDSEVDRDRKAPVKRQRSSRTIVLSDSESESPCPRIKKSPRCQIFPRQPLNSAVSRTNVSPRPRPRIPMLVGGMKLDVDVREQSVERMQLNKCPLRSSSISPLIFPDEEDEDDVEIDSDTEEFMDPVRQVQQMEEDEDLARRLQAEFDAEADTPRVPPRRNTHSHSSQTRQLRPRRVPAQQERRIAATFRVNNQMNGMDGAVTTLPLRIELRPIPQGTRVAFQRPPRAARGGRWDAWNLLFNDIDDDYEGLLDLADLMGEVRQKGLTDAQIGQLPTRTVANEQVLKKTPSGSRSRCHICMCDYEVGEEMRSLTCFHEFHSGCIDRWLRENATCPICRAEVTLNGETH
uniref:RING-type domain-containing protein n=1 Tax=Strigamia maritima TaxID=126957 RepID=T1JDX2_STRMM